MSWTWKLAIRELRSNRLFAWFFVLNLSLGLTGFILLDAVGVSIETELARGSQQIHGADVNISCQNRYCTDRELQTIKNQLTADSATSVSVSGFSMASVNGKTQLIQLVAIDPLYPLYGTLSLLGDKRESLNSGETWIMPEVATRLNLSVGATLKVGNLGLKVAGIIDQDSTGGVASLGFVPRIYVPLDDAAKSGLYVQGSRFNHTIGIRDTSLDLTKRFKKALPQRDIQIVAHQQASENLQRSLTMLTDYLGLMALIALFLAAVGSAFLMRSYLVRRTQAIATMQALGASTWQAQSVYIMQLLLLGIASALLAIICAAILLPLIPYLVRNILPMPLSPKLFPQVILVGMAMGSFGSILICLPLLLKIAEIRPIHLLRQNVVDAGSAFKRSLAFVPMITLFFVLAYFETDSWKISAGFVSGTLVSLAAFLLLGRFIIGLLARFAWSSFNLRMAIRYLHRQRYSSSACIVALAFGCMLLFSVPQIYRLVYEEISAPPGFKIPSLFVIDIQEDQLEPLTKLATEMGTNLEHVSPMVRARLKSINGTTQVRSTKERNSADDEEAEWARTRGQNLSYREHFADSEKIVAGKAFTGRYDSTSGKVPEISIEQRYASRMGVKLGDRLVFDVQGVDVEGEVLSFRRVKWTSFQPNFFVIFQPGVLEEAPKVFLASIPQVGDQEKFKIQNMIIDKFSNLSVVDVATAVNRILFLVAKMADMVMIMALFTLVTGLVVLSSIAYHQAFIRQRDANLLKILGMDTRTLMLTISVESFVLAILSVVLGAGFSLILSYLVSHFVFDAALTVVWLPLVYSAFAVPIVVVLVSLIASRRVFNDRPKLLA